MSSSLSEARLHLMAPAILFMCSIERMYRDIEDGSATLEQVLPWIQVANAKIEALVCDRLLFIMLLQRVQGDERYRMKHFVNG